MSEYCNQCLAFGEESDKIVMKAVASLVQCAWIESFWEEFHIFSSDVEGRIAVVTGAGFLCWWSSETHGQKESSCQGKKTCEQEMNFYYTLVKYTLYILSEQKQLTLQKFG